MTRRKRRKNKVPPEAFASSRSRLAGWQIVHIIIGLIIVAAVSTAISLVIVNRLNHKDSSQLDAFNSQLEKLRDCQIVPEYKRRLKKAVFSLGTVNTTLSLQDGLLSCLPEYTQIILLLPECNLKAIENELKDKPYCDRVRIVPFEEHKHKDGCFLLVFPDKNKLVQIETRDYWGSKQPGTAWAQDLFEIMRKPEGRIILLTPEVHKYYCCVDPETNTKMLADNVYLKDISIAGAEVVRSPLVFQGGNIFVDEINEQRIVFCGGDILNTTRLVWHSISGKKLSDSEIIGLVTLIFNADRVVVASIDVGDRLQPRLMYHLDQAMVLLGDRVVGLTRIVNQPSVKPADDNEVRLVMRFLAKLKTVLLGLGYKVIDIDITVDNLLHYQHYVNAIPYIDVETGQKTLLMPVFSKQMNFQKELEKRNIASFESVGYEVITVPTNADQIKGGIHCLVNVLE